MRVCVRVNDSYRFLWWEMWLFERHFRFCMFWICIVSKWIQDSGWYLSLLFSYSIKFHVRILTKAIQFLRKYLSVYVFHMRVDIIRVRIHTGFYLLTLNGLSSWNWMKIKAFCMHGPINEWRIFHIVDVRAYFSVSYGVLCANFTCIFFQIG